MSKIIQVEYENATTGDPAAVSAGLYPDVLSEYRAMMVASVNKGYGLVKSITGTAALPITTIPVSLHPTVILQNNGPALLLSLTNVTTSPATSPVNVTLGVTANQTITIPGYWLGATSTLSAAQPNTTAPYQTASNVAVFWYL